MSISKIATVWLPVTDMDRSVKFFRDSLGLDVEEHQGDEWSEVTAGDVRIGLNGRDQEQPGSGGGVIAFHSDDIEADKEELEGKGVEFAGPITDHPWGRIATFHDPDGTELQLYAPPA